MLRFSVLFRDVSGHLTDCGEETRLALPHLVLPSVMGSTADEQVPGVWCHLRDVGSTPRTHIVNVATHGELMVKS